MKFTQIATDGGLLPFPLTRDNFELWPAKRRELIVDFTKYQDGSPTTKGDVIYLTNVMKMPDGRMWDNSSRFLPDPEYKVPCSKFVIGDDAPDDSVIPDQAARRCRRCRRLEDLLDNRLIFEVQRGAARRRDRVAHQRRGVRPDTVDARSLKNPAGLHAAGPAEERAASTSGRSATAAAAGCTPSTCTWRSTAPSCATAGTSPADRTRAPRRQSRARTWWPSTRASPSIIYRGFRDFVGPYVAHCHNLAHEDHAMMFGWSITP